MARERSLIQLAPVLIVIVPLGLIDEIARTADKLCPETLLLNVSLYVFQSRPGIEENHALNGGDPSVFNKMR